ncbi:hypothetical protein EV195_1129 [Tenacibaculum skagerrakense]|uniref:Uncharacterized protein n=1 Tax=Tenacibaculum skagerrakense TaxID=186571 RepID=A0A4R2NLE1_9FLAO|nr:DUF5677 domain-containing protein [Tenacibaculum skagerrakense]TCP22360.1 hypothetical protein EV195_1129 [Tenacibaculum skagerrakense]
MTTIAHLTNEARLLAELANSNLGNLAGRCPNKIEVQDYYLGILRRQAILLLDMEKILNNRNPELITTPFILLRSLMDDFLHLLYLELHADSEEEIVKINAKTHKQSFKSLEDLTASNHNHFNGAYTFYLNNEQFQALKDTFTGKAENDKYFSDKPQFRFKNFIPLSQVADNITHSREIEIFKDRAFYLWKEFSSFVHYSNSSFYLETNPNPINLLKIEEGFQYCYNSIYLSFKYFERTLGIPFTDNAELRGRHGIIYVC